VIERSPATRRRLLLVYGAVLLCSAALFGVSLHIGSSEKSPVSVTAAYGVPAGAPCLPDGFDLTQSGVFVTLHGPGKAGGKLRLHGNRLSGTVTCSNGSHEALGLDRTGGGLAGTIGVAAFRTSSTTLPHEAAKTPPPKRSGEETFARLMLAIAAVIVAARVLRIALGRIGQPPVMGEILAGILLGPTLLGAIWSSAEGYLFPTDIVSLLQGAADIGLAFYMFLVGLELDPRMLRERFLEAAVISNTSVVVPLGLGAAAAIPLYELLGPGNKSFLPFALFVGVAMSITAFPVLARILIDRRMLKRPVGATALACAAVDDVTAWVLLAFASAVAKQKGAWGDIAQVVALVFAFCAAMVLVGRRLLQRVSAAYDEAGHLPAAWIALIFVGVLLSSWATGFIGVAPIFGAFVMGLIMPRRADLSNDVSRRIEDFVGTLLLPLFFVVTGLRTDVGHLDRVELWLLAAMVIAVAISAKWLAAMGISRVAGFRWRESAALGVLMNTRGLTELIVLNIGLELGLITPALFTILVIMALVTTFMAAPALRLIDPRGELSAPPEEELRVAPEPGAERPKRSILVIPMHESNLGELLSLAEPLALSQPERELIVASLLEAPRTTPPIAAEDRELHRVSGLLEQRAEILRERGIAVRTVAYTSPDRGKDVIRLASENEVDLVLLDGRRPLLGGAIPRGAVGSVLADAPCDVAVLVEHGGAVPEVDPDHAVLVPFGGATHDWAALELGAWIAASRDAPLKLVGSATGADNGAQDASRLLATASLVVQRMAGVSTEPVLAEPGRAGVLKAAEGAGLLVIGLSERWRQEGLGEVRAEIATKAGVPALFVRRGTRPGILAPPDDVTRFAWSMSG
jgi:Kef-type K+ transport system membrane component KefB